MPKLKMTRERYVICDKKRTVIAKGNPRNRWLIPINDKKDNKRIMTYSTMTKAEANKTRFYNNKSRDEMEGVKVKITIEEI